MAAIRRYRIEIHTKQGEVQTKLFEGTEREANAEAATYTNTQPPLIRVIDDQTNEMVHEFARR